MNEIVWNKKCLLSPSLICLDMMNLSEQVKQIEQAGIELLHIDILDGHFSPSIPLGFETVKQLRAITDLPFECHVMTEDPEYFIDELLDIGVQQIVFHIETAKHIDGLINKIHSRGVRAGVALKPATSLYQLEYIIYKCDAILLMQINPGYASVKGEARVQYADQKIKRLRKMIDDYHLDTKIILDGRVSIETIKTYGKDIVDIFVGGTTCLDKNDIAGTTNRFMDVRKTILGE